MTETIACPIWGSEAETIGVGRQDGLVNQAGLVIRSERGGGTYSIDLAGRAALSDLTDADKAKLTTWIVDQNRLGAMAEITWSIIQGVKRLPRLSPVERSHRLLAFLVGASGRIGQSLHIELGVGKGLGDTSAKTLAWSESLDADEVLILLRFLSEQNAVHLREQRTIRGGLFADVTVNVNGYVLLEQTKVARISHQAFVAMWFSPEMQDGYELGIAPAVIDAGYRPLRIDRKEHSNKIDDEIIAEIRKSRFLIADFTTGSVQTSDGKEIALARGGVYYEAGFAQGLSMPVIWTVKRSQIDSVHFDTRQFNHITWDTPDDLRKALMNRIIAVVGEGPGRTNENRAEIV